MRGLADQRLSPLLERGVALSSTEGRSGAARGMAPKPASGPATRKRFRAVSRTLDGVGGLGWSVVGFVAGAIFWHFVGFWGFVSEVVLADDPPIERAAAIFRVLPAAPAKRVQVAAVAGAPCTLVSRDRQTGRTSARPCDRDHPTLPQDPYQGRQDRIDTTGRDGRLPLKTVGTLGP